MTVEVPKPKHTHDAKGIPLELYEMILAPKREKLADLIKQVAYLQQEVTQLEETLKDRIDSTTVYYDTYMQI